MIRLPMRLASGYPFRVKTSTDADGGWTIVECDDLDHARTLMREYPYARMPSWDNPKAPWNAR